MEKIEMSFKITVFKSDFVDIHDYIKRLDDETWVLTNNSQQEK